MEAREDGALVADERAAVVERAGVDLGILDASVDGTWREADLGALGVAP